MFKKVLFICSANKDRSRTAEDFFSKMYPNISFDSAGTNKHICFKLGTNYISEEQLQWADRIFVMETKHLNAVKKLFGNKFYNKIKVLHIKDVYAYGSNDLISLLKSKVGMEIS